MAHQHIHRRHAHHIGDDIVVDLEERGLTVTRTVMTTMPATFKGSTAGHTTLGAETDTSSAGILHATSTSEILASTTKTSAQDGTTSAASGAILNPSTSVPSTMAVLAATSTPATLVASSSLASAAAATSSSSAYQDASGSGMSSGGKAGLAIGIILGLGAVLSLVLFCFHQRKKAQERQRLDDEKSSTPGADNFGHAPAAIPRSNSGSAAPRLSLRPVTQFFAFGEKRNSRGNELETMTANSGPMATHLTPQSAWGERPITSKSQSDMANPFGNHAEAVDPVNADGPAVVEGISAGGTVIAGTAGAGLTRGASQRQNNSKQLDFTKALPPPGPPSPSGTEFSNSEATGVPVQTSGGAAIAAAGGPKNSAVHRVQLDFTPSMDDELELKAGQLIRLLHEYDDGWALCIRLDRSRQGVVPRTCLSTRPVKPRPAQNGPRGPPPPGMRGPPQGQRRPSGASVNQGPPGPRPGSAQSNRGQGPRYNPQVRPMTPTGQQGRSSSPAGYRRNSPPQARSALGINGNSTPSSAPEPHGLSKKGSIDRKPVPGQAL